MKSMFSHPGPPDGDAGVTGLPPRPTRIRMQAPGSKTSRRPDTAGMVRCESPLYLKFVPLSRTPSLQSYCGREQSVPAAHAFASDGSPYTTTHVSNTALCGSVV